MNRQERGHGLELHDELGTHEEVESRLCNAQALVPNRNRHLPPERDPLQAKLHGESFFVDRFEEARAEVAMNLERRPDHAMRPLSSSPAGSLAFLVSWRFTLPVSATWGRRLPVEPLNERHCF